MKKKRGNELDRCRNERAPELGEARSSSRHGVCDIRPNISAEQVDTRRFAFWSGAAAGVSCRRDPPHRARIVCRSGACPKPSPVTHTPAPPSPSSPLKEAPRKNKSEEKNSRRTVPPRESSSPSPPPDRAGRASSAPSPSARRPAPALLSTRTAEGLPPPSPREMNRRRLSYPSCPTPRASRGTRSSGSSRLRPARTGAGAGRPRLPRPVPRGRRGVHRPRPLVPSGTTRPPLRRRRGLGGPSRRPRRLRIHGPGAGGRARSCCSVSRPLRSQRVRSSLVEETPPERVIG